HLTSTIPHNSITLPYLLLLSFFFLVIPHHTTSTLFPYTTLFRSDGPVADKNLRWFYDNLLQSLGTGRRVDVQKLSVGKHTIMLRSEEHTSELQSRENLVCRLLLEKKKQKKTCMNYRHHTIQSDVY